MNIIIPDVITVIGIPALRSVAGWLNSSLEDRKIDHFEWVKLVETEFRLIVGGALTYYGISLFGFDVNLVAPIFAAAAIDWFYHLYKPKPTA